MAQQASSSEQTGQAKQTKKKGLLAEPIKWLKEKLRPSPKLSVTDVVPTPSPIDDERARIVQELDDAMAAFDEQIDAAFIQEANRIAEEAKLDLEQAGDVIEGEWEVVDNDDKEDEETPTS